MKKRGRYFYGGPGCGTTRPSLHRGAAGPSRRVRWVGVPNLHVIWPMHSCVWKAWLLM